MVAFLFSDIEGSTVRWEQHPEEMSRAIRRHDSVLDAIVTAHGGSVFKNVGDGCCAAFDEPTNALAAALAAQRAIRALDWSGVGGLKVRMALHMGDAERHGADYLGPPLNRVARLLSAGHGGQVLLSGVLADEVRETLPEGVQLRLLGIYRLKDLQAPERIYQADAVDLPLEFQALRTLEAVPNNLPVQATPLVGRRDDIAAVAALFHRSTLVTITGPGGVGKTRVALQCAAELVDRFQDGVWFVNLAPVNDGKLVAETIASVLESGQNDRAGDLNRLLEQLRRSEALLVLDNCEHVLADAAAVVAAIRGKAPRVSVLATSRELLHVAGEQLYRLAPLDLDDAAELFVQRAEAVSAQFDRRQSDAAVRTVCERLDGIPLAIELAAARTRSLSLSDLSARLHERFRLLTEGDRSALPRQQTLRALIDWSYDLLAQEEQSMFRALSVFVGTFSLDAATAVCGGETPDEYAVLDVLTSLADKSLIIASGGPWTRYGMLESIREYAAEKARAGETALGIADRHAAYFGAVASQAYRDFDCGMPQNWLEQLRPDIDNLRAALHWTLEGCGDSTAGAQIAANCGPVFLRLPSPAEGLRWCDAARGVTGLPPETAGRIEYVASMLHNNLDAYPAALACAQHAAQLYRHSNDERGLVRALSQTAQLSARAHRFADAKTFAGEAVSRARSLGQPEMLVAVLRRCAFALPPEQIEDARGMFEEALTTARSVQEREEACRVLEWWAEREAAAGCFERATQLALQGLECADRDSAMCLESNIAGYALASNRVQEAEPHARKALALAVEAQHELACAIAVAYCAPLHASTEPARAAMLYGYAQARMRALDWEGEASDHLALHNAERLIEEYVHPSEMAALLERGARFTLEEALALLTPASAVG